MRVILAQEFRWCGGGKCKVVRFYCWDLGGAAVGNEKQANSTAHQPRKWRWETKNKSALPHISPESGGGKRKTSQPYRTSALKVAVGNKKQDNPTAHLP